MDYPNGARKPGDDAMSAQYSTVGTRPLRPDGADKVTGQAQFGADINLPGVLHGKALRSSHAHARILSIDTRLVEITYPGHLFGVRGVGEAPIIPPAGAIANAIYRATGVRMAELPMSPDRLVKAMTAQSAAKER